MNKRISRFLVVRPTLNGLQISMLWSELNEVSSQYESRVTNLDFFNGSAESAANRLDAFLKGNAFVRCEDGDFRTFSGMLDDMGWVFDIVVDSPEPEQTFLSHQVLEAL